MLTFICYPIKDGRGYFDKAQITLEVLLCSQILILNINLDEDFKKKSQHTEWILNKTEITFIRTLQGRRACIKSSEYILLEILGFL